MAARTDVRQIVIIGASFAGITVAKSLLKDVLPQIKEPHKVVLISPSDKLYWKIGSPRTIVNPAALPIDKVLLPFADTFKNYSADQYQFIEAKADSVKADSKIVELNNSTSVKYDFLVICSGTYFQSDIWSTDKGSEELRRALEGMHGRIPNAQSILVAGGGPAGVETAGELGETYGGKKTITLLSGDHALLGGLQNKNVGKDAEAKLKSMGVKVVHDGVRVKSHRKEGDKDVVELSNGKTETVDVYIEATGDKPNTEFLPTEWVNENKKVKTNPQTLRLNVPGVTGVYVFGSVGSYSNGSIMDIKMAKKAIIESIKSDLKGENSGSRTKNVYNKSPSDTQFVPVGSTGGVGVAFGWKVPSFMVKMAKSKDFMIGQAQGFVNGTA